MVQKGHELKFWPTIGIVEADLRRLIEERTCVVPILMTLLKISLVSLHHLWIISSTKNSKLMGVM